MFKVKDFFNLPKNIYVFFIYNFFRWLSFWIPIFVLFYESIGLSYTQILLLFSARSVVGLIFQIPSGIFADKFGRKFTLVLSSCFEIFGFLIILFSQDFWIAFLGNLFVGLFLSFGSGADEALVYDTLLAEKQKKKYKTVQFINYGINSLALAIASIAGGLIAQNYGLRTTIIFNILAYIVALFIVLLIEDVKQQNGNKFLFTDFKSFLIEPIQVIRKNTSLVYIFVFWSIFKLSSEVIQNFRQPYFNEIGFDYSQIGFINSVFLLVGMAIAFVFNLISEKSKNFNLDFLIVFVLLLLESAFLSIFLNPWVGIVFITTGQISRGLSAIYIRNYVNESISSGFRATILSIQNFFGSLLAILFIPIFGYIADEKGLQVGFGGFFFFALIIGSISLLLFFHSRKFVHSK